MQVSVTLLSSASASDSPTVWQVSVKTSDVKGAGTDAEVFINIIGDGESGEHRLESRSNNFERNATDTFHIKTPPIGEAVALDVWQTNKGFAADWHLDSITLTNTNSGVIKV